MKQFLPVGKRSLGRLDRSKFWGNTSPDCEFCSTYIHLTRWARLKINKKQRDAECLILLGCRNGFSMDFSIVSMFYQWVTQTGFWCGSGFTQKTACSQWRNALVAAPSDSKLEQMRKSCWYGKQRCTDRGGEGWGKSTKTMERTVLSVPKHNPSKQTTLVKEC